VSDTLVFIPAWNEEENLPAVLDELRDELPDVDVLVVDDGSIDKTAAVARERGAEVLALGTNREEVAVDMGPRAGGVSKLRGTKAVKVTLTVIGTLVAGGLIWARRSD